MPISTASDAECLAGIPGDTGVPSGFWKMIVFLTSEPVPNRTADCCDIAVEVASRSVIVRISVFFMCLFIYECTEGLARRLCFQNVEVLQFRVLRRTSRSRYFHIVQISTKNRPKPPDEKVFHLGEPRR